MGSRRARCPWNASRQAVSACILRVVAGRGIASDPVRPRQTQLPQFARASRVRMVTLVVASRLPACWRALAPAPGLGDQTHVEEPWPHMPAQRRRCPWPEGRKIRLGSDDARTGPVELAGRRAARGPSPRRPHGRVCHVRHPASRPPDGGRRRPGLRRRPLVLPGREGVHGPLDLPPSQAGSHGRDGTTDPDSTACTAGNADAQNARRVARRRAGHRIAG
jgi:hypothetical protein